MDNAAIARAARGLHRLRTVAHVVAWLEEQYDATAVPWRQWRDNLADEYVDRKRVRAALTITGPAVPPLASAEERLHFVEDPDDPFDPDEYPAKHREENIALDELNTGRRVFVVLEGRKDREPVTNYRVHGAAQRLREDLWAVTECLPRDPGPTEPGPFADELALQRPDRPDRPL